MRRVQDGAEVLSVRLLRLLLVLIVGFALYPFVALAQWFSHGVVRLLYWLTTEDVREVAEKPFGRW